MACATPRCLAWPFVSASESSFFASPSIKRHTVELLYGLLLILLSLVTGNQIAIFIAIGLMLLKVFHVLVLCILTGAGIGDLPSLALRLPYHAFSWILAIIKSTQLSKTFTPRNTVVNRSKCSPSGLVDRRLAGIMLTQV